MLNVYRRRIGRTLRRRGLLGTARMALGIGLCYLKDALSPARRAVRRCRVARDAEFNAREAEFDQAYGVDTAGIVSLDTIDEVVGPNRDEGNTYEGVDPVLLRERIAALGIDFPQYTFIDLGCGKGRALLIAAQFPFRQVRGVEFAPALHAIAEKNIAVYRGPRRCCDVRADLADAAEYPVPDGPLVVFLYNPFGGAVMDRVLANLTRSHREQPRDIWVIYWNPRRRPCSTGTGSPASPIYQKARRSIGRAIGPSYGGSSPLQRQPRLPQQPLTVIARHERTWISRTPKPRALFHGEVTSDTEMSQLKLSSLREFGSLEHPSGPVTKFCKKLRVRVRRTISASAGCSTSTRTGGHTTDCTLARRRPHDR